jgi:hypothetical protein
LKRGETLPLKVGDAGVYLRPIFDTPLSMDTVSKIRAESVGVCERNFRVQNNVVRTEAFSTRLF